MERREIMDIFCNALDKLLERDRYLLEHDIHERSIAHRLAVYLEEFCSPFDVDVDCEYDGNVNRDNDKKYIQALRDRLEELGRLTKREQENDLQIFPRMVYPDIIMHKLGSNQNHCIIELKTTTRRNIIPIEYDYLKLESYTSNQNGNDLNYTLGVFLMLNTSDNIGAYEIRCYEDGSQLDCIDLT
jgi:hypothetical protein